jgi:hypothetical protein
MGYYIDKVKAKIHDKELETMLTEIDCEKSVESVISLPFIDSLVIPEKYNLKYPDAPADDQELLEIENRVLTKGYVLLWSNTLNDFVAFYKTEADREKIPPGFIPYSDQELRELFGEGKAALSSKTLRLIHNAKKLRAEVVDN